MPCCLKPTLVRVSIVRAFAAIRTEGDFLCHLCKAELKLHMTVAQPASFALP